MRKQALTTILLTGVLAAPALHGCRRAAEPPEVVRPVRVVRVGDPTVLTGRTFPGRAKATQEVNLSFRVSGPLITRNITVGQKVEASKVLAEIDPRDFEVEQRNVQAQLEESRAAYALAEDEHERAITAHERGALTEIELVRKREAMNQAAARVDALQASLDAATDAVSYTRLKAPFDGTIVAIYVENFEDVRAKQPICRVLDDSSIEMIVDVPEHLISLAEYVDDVQARFDAFPDVELTGIVKEIGKEASATTRTYPVTLLFEQPEGVRILPGMTGAAWGRGVRPDQQQASGFELPASAVVAADDGSRFVWVVDEDSGRVTRREVTVGPLSSIGMRVDGLEAGVLVATAGAHYLRDGQTVRILQEASP